MPWAAKVPCKGGCGRAVASGYCEACRAQGKGKDQRASAAKRLYGARWRRRSRAWLREPGHQLCVGYPEGAHGERAVAAQVPDHVVPHKGDPRLFWDESNWQPLCIACNSRKAVAEEGAGWRHA